MKLCLCQLLLVAAAASNEPPSAEVVISTAKAQGGVVGALRAAHRELKDGELQWRALAELSDSELTDVQRERCLGVALPIVLKAMQWHRSNPDVQEWGCRAYRNMAVCERNRKRIGESGAVHAMIDGLRANPSKPMVTARASAALELICKKCGKLLSSRLLPIAAERIVSVGICRASQTRTNLWSRTVVGSR